MAMKAKNTGMVILGGGLIKHHICNANLMVIFFISIELRFGIFFELIIFFLFFQRNGADFSLFVNTANEFDGSDSGARPDEAISWGKIRREAKPVKVI